MYRKRAVFTVLASAALAVGAKTAAGFQHGFAETWNGTAWTGQAIPRPKGSANTGLLDASCTAPDSCVAVGNELPTGEYGQYGPYRSVAWHWNGATWNILAVLNLAKKGTSTSFTQISCTSATACTALGQYPFNETDSYQTQVAARWNGTGWTIHTLASKAGTAVGGYSTAQGHGKPLALFERWNGTTWHTQAPSALAGQVYLSSVSCSAPTACTAVGYVSNGLASSDRTLAEAWNGTTWVVQPTAV